MVILSGHSLFADGIAQRLQHQEQAELFRIDSRQTDALAQIVAVQPSVVILDANDPDVDQHCPLNAILEALPSLKVIRLDSQQAHVQIVTSERRWVESVDDLLDVIGSSDR